MLSVFLFLIPALCCVFTFLFFKNKLDIQKKQLWLLSNQNNALRSNVTKNIVIKYSTPEFRYGYTSENCSLSIAPLDNAASICKLRQNTALVIVDFAEVNSVFWYEVSVPSKDRINNKGWIRSTKIIFPESLKTISSPV